MAVDPNRSLMPAWLPAVNRRLTNRIQGLWAPYAPGYAMVLHVGRRSGRSYRTPVMAMRHDGRLIIALPYGARAQWVRNLQAAGGGVALRHGGRLALSRPRILTDAVTEPVPRLAQRLVRRMPLLVLDCAGGRRPGEAGASGDG